MLKSVRLKDAERDPALLPSTVTRQNHSEDVVAVEM